MRCASQAIHKEIAKAEISPRIYLLIEVILCASKLASARVKTHMICGGVPFSAHPANSCHLLFS